MVRLATVALAGVALLAAAPVQAAAPPAGRADRNLDRALERLVDADGGPPGAIAVVQRGSRRIVATAGVSNLATRAPLRASHHMRIASVSKAFVGATALRLVARGRLSLDATIGDTLDDMPAAWGDVTLGQALNHTSGLPDYSENPAFLQWFVDHLRDYISPRAVLDYVRHEPLRFPPGSDYRYSNTDNIIAGLFVEAATGRSYARVLRDLVLRPLGLRRTSLPNDWRMPRPFIHGYDIDPPNPPEDVSQLASVSSLWAAGAVVSTPLELNRFIRAYAGGRLFSPSVRRRQTDVRPGESQPPGPGHNAAGMAIFRYRTKCGTLYGHTGNFPGYTQFAAAAPSGRRSVVISATVQLERNTGSREAFAQLRKAFLAGACAALARR